MKRSKATLLALLTSGCTLLLDGGRHRGNDAGTDRPDSATPDGGHDAGTDAGPGCDIDGDGHDATSCGGDDCDDGDATRYPGAAPVCGDGNVEGCPGDDFPGEFFGSPIAGLIAPIELGSGADYGTDLGLALTDIGGGGLGTAVVLLRPDGGARRFDVQLDDPSAPTEVPLVDSNDNVLADETEVSGVALSGAGAGVITMSISHPDGQWYSVIDFVRGDRDIDFFAEPALQPPVVVSGFARISRTDGGTNRMMIYSYSELAAQVFPSEPSAALPSGYRRTTASGGWVMIESGGEDLHFWLFEQNAPVVAVTYTGLTGHAAFGSRSGGPFIAYPRGGDVRVTAPRCERSDGCVPPGELPTSETIVRTGADSADALSAAEVSGGATVFLIAEHHADRDVLSLQPVASNGSIPHARIALLTLPGERIVDARVQTTGTADGGTVYVVALVAPGDGQPARRVLATGVRTCAAD